MRHTAEPPDRKPIRVLCLDIEGGHGGSSRSLYESIRHLDGREVAAEIWCRRGGKIESWYRSLGVTCRVFPDMPKVSSLPRLSRNLIVYTRAFVDFLRAVRFRQQLVAAVNERFDVVHFNHEALFLLAAWLRPRSRAAFTMHLRTNLHPSWFARWQHRLISRAMDRLVFITPNEEASHRRFGGTGTGTIIYNIVRIPEDVSPLEGIPQDHRFRVSCLSNYSWYRGTDRLIEVAQVLKSRQKHDVLFVVAGDHRLQPTLPGDLGRIGRLGGDLAAYAAHAGVSDYFLFLKHTPEPERVLIACHMMIKPTREANPWGRDVIEAAALGLPTVAVGTAAIFVENDKTGVLIPDYTAERMADAVIALAGDRARCAALGQAAKARAQALCDGPARAADLTAVWRSVLSRPATVSAAVG